MPDSPNKRKREADKRRKKLAKAERKRLRKEGLLPTAGPVTWEEPALPGQSGPPSPS